jgi:alpha-tubulin suppressor-like RCC1 family protein
VITRNPQGFTLFQAGDAAITLRFTAAAMDLFPPTIRWQESATGSAGPFSDIVGNPSASTGTLVLENVSAALHGHAFRAVFANNRESAVTDAAVVTVVAVAGSLNFASAAEIPLAGDRPAVSGELAITLGFAPVPGTDLTVLRNTGPAFIQGTFANLPQGAVIPLTFGGMTHSYVVDYFGGNGRSLVLHWPQTRLVAWGGNSSGQLGNNSLNSSRQPVAVVATGPLAGKTITRIAAGGSHSLTLTADGQLRAWGSNSYGQLGDGGTGYNGVPVAVDNTGALTGKTLVGIAAGDTHSLALAADGSVFGWGRNAGQLGNGTTANSAVPVAVDANGGLAGKQVVAVAAGGGHSLALTSEGRVLAWGAGTFGQLGTGASATSLTPVDVVTSGALSGKTVIAIAAGFSHSLALTSDGSVFAWGSNNAGQLGAGYGAPGVSYVPLAVPATGVLTGKTVVAIAAGAYHSAVLTADGKVFTWGMGQTGQLGNNGTSTSQVPVAVAVGGAAAGKSVTGLAAGSNHCLTLASDGRAYAWGDNQSYQLGDNSFNPYSTYPVAATTTGAIGTRWTMAVAGGGSHSLAIAGVGYVPTVASHPENRITSAGATVTLTATATGLPAPTVRWQVSSKGAIGPFTNLGGNATATTGSLVLTGVTAAQHGYAYRAVFTNVEGSVTTASATLTVNPAPVLTLPANLTVTAVTKDGAAVGFATSALDSVDGPVPTQCTPPSGSVFPIGTTTVQCTATNSLGGVATGSFTVTVLRSFAAFQNQYNLTGGGAADPFHTGLTNLTAYAFGINPAAPDRSRLPAVTITDGYLQVSYDRWRDAADLQYVVEVSDDLQLWQSGPGHVIPVSATPLDASRERVIERDTTAVAGKPRRFIRVRLFQ